ncbi:MAG: hypothetical protein ACRD98_03455, partial [Nitrososphaera sp.]
RTTNDRILESHCLKPTLDLTYSREHISLRLMVRRELFKKPKIYSIGGLVGHRYRADPVPEGGIDEVIDDLCGEYGCAAIAETAP